jgi:DUF917 family protein
MTYIKHTPKESTLRTIEIFTSLGEHLFEDQTVRKYGTILVMNGVKNGLKKINPIVLWIDAGLSVIEAGNSYLNYAKEQEITKQIRLENEVIKKQLDSQIKILKLKNIQEFEAGEVRIKELSQQLNKQLKVISVNNHNLVKSINDNLVITKRMLQLVKKERENVENFEKLQKLQTILDIFIRASLMCLIYSADDTGAMVE